MMLKKVRFKVGKMLSGGCDKTFPSKKSFHFENVLHSESVKRYIVL